MNGDTENRYQTILETIIEGYYESDLAGTVIFCNPSFASIAELPLETVRGMNYKEFISPEDREKVFKTFNSVYKTGQTAVLVNWEMIAPNGHKKHIEGSVSLITEDGKPAGFRGILRDITGYTRVQEALEESDQRYLEIINSLPEIIFELDSEGRITFINDKASEILGYTHEELCNYTIHDIVPGEDVPRLKAGLNATLQGIKQTGISFSFRKKDGQYQPFEVYTNSVRKNRKITGIRGIAIDLSNILQAEKALKENEEKFRTLLENSTEIVAVLDEMGILRYESPSAFRILGYTQQERLGTNAFDFVHPEDREELAQRFTEEKKRRGDVVVAEYRYRHKNGTWRYLETTGSNFLNNPYIRGIILNTRDVTDRKLAEKGLKKREDKYRSLYDNALIGMITTDFKTGIVLESNDLGYGLFGHSSKNEFLGNAITDYYRNPDDREKLLRDISLKNETHNAEIEMTRADGTPFWAELSARFDAEKGNIDIALIDISKRRSAEEKVTYYTFYDQLTELPNREMFSNRLHTEILRGRNAEVEPCFSVMCMGIDKFKNINEMHGPYVGDKLLQKVARRLKHSFRNDDLVARLDGDKFMMLLTELTHRDNVGNIIQKVFDVFSDPFIIDSNVFSISVSIGVCLYPSDGNSTETLIKNAEMSMYLAKTKSRNSYCLFDAKMNEEMMLKLQLEQELQVAIINNEFVPHFQPKVTQEGRIIGMESLIRWNSPSRGMVSPFHFIPLAETNGMIEEIGNLILLHSCTINKQWQAMGLPPMRVAVNISPMQFRQPNIVSRIEAAIRETGLSPEWLELEITESGIMENEKETILKLNQLNDMGITISIDDFGTGYSSLSKLKDYPIDTLKIDKSFIDNLPHNTKSATIATTIIDLAHNLGFKVVAEGVETKEQLDFLIEHNCDLFQGYFFYKPLPPDVFEKEIRKPHK